MVGSGRLNSGSDWRGLDASPTLHRQRGHSANARPLHGKVCQCRLGYGRHRGNGGIYEYFSCLSRMSKQGRCVAPYFRVTTVEQRVEQKYRRYLLDPTEQAVIREALLSRAETMAQAARKEASRHTRRLRELTSQQQKLVHLYYSQGVSKEVMKAEQERIEAKSNAGRLPPPTRSLRSTKRYPTHWCSSTLAPPPT